VRPSSWYLTIRPVICPCISSECSRCGISRTALKRLCRRLVEGLKAGVSNGGHTSLRMAATYSSCRLRKPVSPCGIETRCVTYLDVHLGISSSRTHLRRPQGRGCLVCCGMRRPQGRMFWTLLVASIRIQKLVASVPIPKRRSTIRRRWSRFLSIWSTCRPRPSIRAPSSLSLMSKRSKVLSIRAVRDF
jgi:hypothetical protein